MHPDKANRPPISWIPLAKNPPAFGQSLSNAL